ncbi:Transcription elongation factor B polypeptide 3 [Hordeum vulgare]|nr:Transcription elongation factor B polypeptide 3 [Hordeum vulgare]
MAGIKDEFDNLCAVAEFCDAIGVRNVGKTTRMKVQPYELKFLFASLCSKDPQDIHRGESSSIVLPHIRCFAYYIARGVLARDNTSNISAPDIAILAAALSGDNTYNIGALIARRLVANNGKEPHFGGIYATLIPEHLERTIRTDDAPFPFIRFDLTAMKRHEFVTRTFEFGNLVYIMRFGEFTTREIRLPAQLLFDYTSRNGWSFTAIELDEFVIQQQFHNPMEGVVPEEEQPSSWEDGRTSIQPSILRPQPTHIEFRSSERDEIEEHIRSKAAVAAAESSALSTPPTSNPIANPLLRTDAQRNAFFDAPARPLAAATRIGQEGKKMEPERKPLSLLELCFRSAVDNLRYMNSVDNLEMGLLKRILPHCTLEQLTHIESCTEMDLTGVTDVLWKRFFQREFGEADMNVAIKRMKESGVRYKWKKLFEEKTEKQKQVEQRMSAGLRNKYEAANAGTTGRKQGTSSKAASLPSTESLLCKIRLAEAFISLEHPLVTKFHHEKIAYRAIKDMACEYQQMLELLRKAPFFGRWRAKPGSVDSLIVLR